MEYLDSCRNCQKFNGSWQTISAITDLTSALDIATPWHLTLLAGCDKTHLGKVGIDRLDNEGHTTTFFLRDSESEAKRENKIYKIPG